MHVKASVDAHENGNYAAIESDIIRFTVFETSIFTAPSRVFEQLESGMATTLNIKKDGEFTVYYETQYVENMALNFSRNIEVGAKLTLISDCCRF